jgi:hypothetical protein
MSHVALAPIIIFALHLENAPSFDEANFSSFLDQGKHLASSLNRILLYNIYIVP